MRLRHTLSVPVLMFLTVSLFFTSLPLAKVEKSDSDYDVSRMEGFSWVLIQLKQDYVDPSRVRPAAMISRSLEFIEHRLSEVEIKLSEGVATVQVGSAKKTFEVGVPKTVWEMNYNLQPIISFVGEGIESTSDPRDVEFAAIDGMLSTLDPHSNLLPPELFREMKLKTTGEFGGLGIRITIRKGVLTIISPLPDTPAARMGLKAMDQIVRIKDQSTVNMSLDEAVSMLRGKPGTKIAIWVMRSGWSEPHKYVITRETIRVRSIVSKLLKSRIGYIQIQDFGRHTDDDLRRHLSRMKRKAKGLEGLIIDLRNNAGGLMRSAVEVADMFLEKGIIVATVAYGEDSTIVEKIQKSREEKRATDEDVEEDIPVVVLINSGSASASEILAGALKNLDRAVLMGDQTFGKGTVQILNDRVPESIAGACLKLTVAEYLIPGDVSIQEVGVTPDIQLVPVVLDKENLRVFAEQRRFREADIPAHLKKHGARKLKPAEIVRYVYEEEEKEGENQEEEPVFVEEGYREDFEIRLAYDFLLEVDANEGSAMLDQAIGFIREVQKEQQQKMIEKLGGLGVDWSEGSSGETQGEATFELVGEKIGEKGAAVADTEVVMRLKVSNKGSVPFQRLRAESESKFELYNRKEFLFGRVDPNETKVWEIPIKVPRGVLSRADDVRFTFHCEGGTPPKPLEKVIYTRGLERPAFGFNWRVLDPDGNKDGLIQPGEEIQLAVSVHNHGKGKALMAKALLKNEAGKDLFLKAGKGRIVLKEIPPGKSATESFHFRVHADTGRENLPVELTIWDSEFGMSQTAKLDLPISKAGLRPSRVRTGLRVTRPRAKIRSGAGQQAPLLAFAKKGGCFLADRQQGDWYHVSWPSDGNGWIRTNAVKRVSRRRAKSQPALIAHHQITPPEIRLSKVPFYLKNDDQLVVKGEVRDTDRDIRDIAVWVGDDKVYLRSGSQAQNPRNMAFEVDVKLKPGPNLVSVIAREGNKYSSQSMLLLTRPGGLDYDEEELKLADGKDASLILE